jgi:hypothetical protein
VKPPVSNRQPFTPTFGPADPAKPLGNLVTLKPGMTKFNLPARNGVAPKK